MQVSLAPPLWKKTAFLPTSAQSMTVCHSRGWKPAVADVVLDHGLRVRALEVADLAIDDEVLARGRPADAHEDDVGGQGDDLPEAVRRLDVGVRRGGGAAAGRSGQGDAASSRASEWSHRVASVIVVEPARRQPIRRHARLRSCQLGG